LHFRDQYRKLAGYLNIISGKEALLKADYQKRLEDEVKARDTELDQLKRQVAELKLSADKFNAIYDAIKKEPEGRL